MMDPNRKPGEARDVGNPTLFYVIVGLIVLLLAGFLLLKPRGPNAKAPRSSKSSLVMPAPLSSSAAG